MSTQYYSVADEELFTPPHDEEGQFIPVRVPLPIPPDWKPPVVLPLVKLDVPEGFDPVTYLNDPATHKCEPHIVVYDDRAERDWKIIPLTDEEQAAAARKIWQKAAHFLSEFSMPEMAAISISTDPTIAALRLMLSAWPGPIWSDDARIAGGLAYLVESGILTEARKAVILVKI
jgi:hypothetical protein